MAKAKLGIGQMEINKKFESFEEAYTYSKNLKQFIYDICKRKANKDGSKKYLYYKCKDCGDYVREEQIEEALVDKLQDILELYLAVEGTYFAIDSDLAEDFNKCRVNNRIRFVIDRNIIEEKLNFVSRNELLGELWDKADYETKYKFISKYVDYVEIKKSEDKKNASIDIIGLNIMTHKVQMMAELSKNNMIDEIISHGAFKVSKAEYKSRKEADKYINILKKKYDFNVIDFSCWFYSYYLVLNLKI